jgi:hypothetical protein
MSKGSMGIENSSHSKSRSSLDLRRLPCALLASLGLLVPVPSAQAQWEISKVADFSTPIPGGQGKEFDILGAPAISAHCVAFYGRSGDFHSPNQVGIFMSDGSLLQIVADQFTAIPGGTGASFTRFDDPSIDGCTAAFWGQNHFFPLHEGIYTRSLDILRAVATQDTPVPGGQGTFASHFSPIVSSDSGNAAFTNWGFGGQEGVYTEIGGTLDFVANLNTPIPGGQGNFTRPSGSMAFDEVSLSGDNVAFVGRGVGQEGIYSDVGGALGVVVDLNTVLPGGTEPATGFRGPSIDGTDFAFYASRGTAHKGIYSMIDGTLHVVADVQTPVPGLPFTFSLFDVFTALHDESVVFWGRTAGGYAGIFFYHRGTIFKVIDNTDTLNGKTVAHPTFGPHALSHGRVAFKVTFDDFTQGVYVARFLPIFHDGFETGDLSAWSGSSDP